MIYHHSENPGWEQGPTEKRLARPIKAPVQLAGHPLALPIDTMLGEGDRAIASSVFLIAGPDRPFDAIPRIAAIANQCSLKARGATAQVRYLRVLVAEDHLYHEIGCTDGVFLCGGCSPHTMPGANVIQRIDWLFAYIAESCTIPIERRELDRSMAHKIRAVLNRAWGQMPS